MARPRQPIELVVAKGKKHLTKSEIEARKKQEVKAPSDNIRAPSFLNAAQKREFKKIAAQLVAIGIMSNLDCDSLAMYLRNKDEWIFYDTKLNESIMNEDLEMIDYYRKCKKDAFKQVRDSASDLGLTIASRCKLVVPTNNENSTPPQNKFARFNA
ncbi:phage terminase small subunit P27 family [Bacillus sp. JJ722]|uniref:phage terminase small subunit P27 family n=1 Tax=Bacillus sp. JJ722 TaxID=3122973 RepID=UPI002FFE1796